MFRCIRIWTAEDGNSRFEEGSLALAPGAHGDLLSGKISSTTLSFQETAPGGALEWHTAPVRQFVVTLAGTLDFETRSGAHFILRPGDVLLAEDTAGSGHTWRLVGDQPWRRMYVGLADGAEVAFTRAP